ncbi:MAG: methyltransferase domain-containing protein [Nanoarchaeota archaeon]
MEKGQIESQSKEIAEYFKKYWTSYADPNFDRTFSLRNWATIMATIILYYNKNKNNKKNNKDIKNINKKDDNNYENELKKLFKNKKILHIGCGYGYFLEVIKRLNAVPFGIEPYCSFPDNLNIIKARAEDLQDNNSELSKILNGEKFDTIVAHDLFLFSILINKENAHKIIKSLKKYLNKKGVMVFESMNEETLLEKDEIEKLGFKAEYIENIANPYGRICSQVLIFN